jgi:adenylate cyclase
VETGGESEAPDPTLGRLDAELLGGVPTLRLERLAADAGVSEAFARGFWRAMGFPDAQADTPAFTAQDVAALRAVAGLIADGVMDERTASSLIRALGHTSDRLALWETEALVEDAVRRHALDDTSARLLVLDRLPEVVDGLEELLSYVWRRQMAALAHRTHDEVALRHLEEDVLDRLPLIRAVGFADMVSFTQLTASLGAQDLASLVQSFEDTARDVVTAAGARVVKMIGDAVLYVADDLPTGAGVALDLVDAIRVLPSGVSVRSSLVWGRVLSRSGDIFGPTVNLAARLADVAMPGTVLMDRASAAALATAGVTGLALVPQYPTEVDGLGLVTPVELRRA